MRVALFAAALVAVSFALAACDDEPVAPRVETVVDAGSLKLSVSWSPWAMTFLDANDQPVLAEQSSTGDGPTGTLAIFPGPPPPGCGGQPSLPCYMGGGEGEPRSPLPATPPDRATGWFHATEVIDSRMDGDTWVATLATTDPTRTLVVRAVAESEGVIGLTVTASTSDGVQALGVAFSALADERFVGFGERSNAVDQSGRAIENYVAEGPYQDDDYDLIPDVLPPAGVRWRPDTTYFPIPWLLSSRGYGVLLDNDELSYHRVGTESPEAWSMEVESAEMRFRVFAGPTPAEALERFTASVGRQPPDYAPWFFGPWVDPDNPPPDRDYAMIDDFREADVPTSLTMTYIHYLPDGQDTTLEEGREAWRVETLHAKGTAVHTYFNPMITTDHPVYEATAAAGGLIRDAAGTTYEYLYFGDQFFSVSQFDFSSPSGLDAYQALTDVALGHGYDGWMEDYGEYTPLDAVSDDGVTGTAFHNRYARDYHCGIFDVTADAGRPLARYARSGWTGSAACSPIVWGGDPTTTWGADGLESAIYEALSMGTSGVAIWGSAIGGFMYLRPPYELTDELLDRWIAFGGLSVIMRNEKNGLTVTQENLHRPQLWEEAHLPIWRRYAKLHTDLYPYIQAAAETYYATGLPVMRHLVLTDPTDPDATARDDQYLFGPDLLVAPVHEEGATERELYLPAGSWVDWWRSVEYVEADGSFELGAVEMRAGLATLTVPAPLEQIPLFVRAGAIIPMLAPDVFTLADYGDDPSIVHLSDREDQLYVIAFPRGEYSGTFFDSGTWSSVEGDGTWTLRLQDGRQRTIHLQASMSTLEQPFEPCPVTHDGTAVPETDWSFDAETEVLDVEYLDRGGELVVSASGCGR